MYRFPRAFEQVYFALEAVAPTENSQAEDRIQRAFSAFPWRGGYSAVNFYEQLKLATPPLERPVIKRINYSSPGVIELTLNVALAIHVGVVVSSVAGSILACNRVYHRIYTNLQQRKLLRLEVERRQAELTRDELIMVEEMADAMARILDLPSAQFLHERTENPLVSLKILLSLYRRVRTLVEFKVRGKADLRSINQMIEDGDL